jgi:hypothetical protein
MTNSYNNNLGLLTMEKQSQTNPIHSAFIRVNSWLNSKQTQSKPTCLAEASAKADLFRLPAIACLFSIALAKEKATAEAQSRNLSKQLSTSGKLKSKMGYSLNCLEQKILQKYVKNT